MIIEALLFLSVIAVIAVFLYKKNNPKTPPIDIDLDKFFRESSIENNSRFDNNKTKTPSDCNFVAIDFETFTAERTSACAIGMCKVKKGVIIQEFYSLISPIPDERTTNNTFVHGITKEMLLDAPTFKELFPFIVQFCEGLPFVCHNASMDEIVMRKCMEYYNLSELDLDFEDTYQITKLSLVDACELYHVPLGEHHNALSDAVACAKLRLALSGKIMVNKTTSSFYGNKSSRISQDVLTPLASSEVTKDKTIFCGKKVRITGTFDAYPDRNDLAEELHLFGANIMTCISKNTNILIVGKNPGWKKIEQVEELNAKGCNIRILYEDDVIKELRK